MTKPNKIIIIGGLGNAGAAQPVTIGSVTSNVVRFNGHPVLTTRQLAAYMACKEKQIGDNHKNNRDRFEEGVHFVKLEGEALRTFKRQPDNFGSVAGQAASLILWTERGAARHAKMLSTDMAWAIFEQLEESYFRHQQAPKLAPAPAIPYSVGKNDTLTKAEQDQLRDALYSGASALPRDQQGEFLMRGWSKLKSHFKTGHYREIPRREFVEALSIVQRHAVEYLPAVQAVQQPAIGHASPDTHAALLAITTALVQVVPVLVELAGQDAANEPMPAPRRRLRRVA